MKKVIALIGSRAGNKSNTKGLCGRFISALSKAFDEEFISEILTADTWNINNCLSCNCCFHKGYCAQDSLDNMSMIKEKILAADIVILASPVYACNVSGDMKTLIDRLSLWLHLMPLIGKIGIPLCTTSNNHSNRVIEYLTEILEYMGASIPTDIRAFIHGGGILMSDEENLNHYLKEKADFILKEYINGLKFSKKQEGYFDSQNKRYAKHIKFAELYPSLSKDLTEAKLWQEAGFDKCTSIYNVLQNRLAEERI